VTSSVDILRHEKRVKQVGSDAGINAAATYRKQRVARVGHEHHCEASLLLWCAVHLERKDHWQLRGGKRALAHCSCHLVKAFAGAECVSCSIWSVWMRACKRARGASSNGRTVLHHGRSRLSVPAVDLTRWGAILKRADQLTGERDGREQSRIRANTKHFNVAAALQQLAAICPKWDTLTRQISQFAHFVGSKSHSGHRHRPN
jgi:hypothetical protein